MISRIIIWRLITLTKTLIILDITKIESNNCFIIQKMKKEMVPTIGGIDHLFLNLLKIYKSASNKRRANLKRLPLEIMHHGHSWPDYLQPLVSSTWLLYNLQIDDILDADFGNSMYTFSQSETRVWVECTTICIISPVNFYSYIIKSCL